MGIKWCYGCFAMETKVRNSAKREAKRKCHKILVDGAKMTAARIAANMTQQDVSDALQCTRSYIGRWEQESLFTSEDRIVELVKLYGTMDFVLMSSGDVESFVRMADRLRDVVKEGKA